MNKRQIEVQKATAKNEQSVLNQLQTTYEESLEDIGNKIKVLQSSKLTQSKIYQIEYQKALEKQVSGILDTMKANNFTTVAEYMQTCYEDGFFGTLYDLQGQGIPLCFPIDQEQMLKVCSYSTDDIKLSKRLYDNVDLFKRNTIAEIGRGISNGYSYEEIAKNLKFYGDTSLGRAMTIARTEGHRVQQSSTLDCQIKAKSKGADVVKQWDSTLDGVTRPTHKALDGQIQEIDKPFVAGGKRAMYPSGFGDPSEDCNCRCCLLQRARWALTDEEFTKMNGDTGELVKLRETEYNKFKKVAKEEIQKQQMSKFQPAKSIKLAEEYCKKTLGINCSYQGIDLDVANDMNRAFSSGLSYCPSIKDRMNFVGSGQQRNKLYKAELTDYYMNKLKEDYSNMPDSWYRKYAKDYASKSVGNISGDTYAFASSVRRDITGGIQTKYTGIAVNEKFGKDAITFSESLKRNVESGYHPIGTDSVTAVFDHEVAHQIDYAIGLRTNPDMLKLYSSLSREEIKQGLSKYATENIAEFIAEGYAEYLNNFKPRKISKKIGNIIEQAVKKNG
ncbi:MAG: phage minor head protein [Lachnotalea sp.]